MFAKVLVANRGEIACRVMHTCHSLGIATVAVYSEADASALHVRQADQAVLLGPPPPVESYLNGEAIIRAALETGAEAVHPGYGFLSQNPTFAAECQRAGLRFIGPSPEVMERMGDKVLARRMAGEAGLPLIPGTSGEVEDSEALASAEEIGFPVMVKAAMGGGGIGIQVVHSPEDLQEIMDRARLLAEGAFGSPRLYIEKCIEGASHVEVQVLADTHGHAVHLFERDCSIQRRHQKVVEETPCVKLQDHQRRAMYDAALALVRHIGYTNAGTVEFLLDSQGEFYFLEMNTRIQVEHPVTEMVTGLDLVALQIRIAAGEPLPFTQDQIRSHGHAVEARLYPEDPATLLPVAGIVDELVEPTVADLRIESALFPGYEVTTYYDALMAKVVGWGESREQALATLAQGLNEYAITGIVTNIPLHLRILAHPHFGSGTYTTSFLSDLLGEEGDQERVAAITAALGSLLGTPPEPRPSPWKVYGRTTQMASRIRRGGRW